MNISAPSEEQLLAVHSFHRYLESEIRPIVLDHRDRYIPRETMAEITQGIAEFGMPGGALPIEHGGMGLSWVSQAMLFEELACVSADLAFVVLINTLAGHLLLQAAPDVRERYLPGLLNGKLFACIGVSEPDCGIERQGHSHARHS